VRRILCRSDLAISELDVTHDGVLVEMVGIIEFEGGRVARETQYLADLQEAPLWRFRRARPKRRWLPRGAPAQGWSRR
jgi:hypothetical protein